MRKCCSITRMRSILYFASDEETVLTQQEICNACFLPKQTVNTAIAGLAQKGLVELELIPGTRNKKRILLMDAGRELEKNTTDRLRGAVYFPTAPFLFVRKKTCK
ncbi:MarR family transcriptional regulator [Blautia sp. AM42-2]|nr:MarR family transcriptional regulator [Blautia sp. AM42-2]